MQSKGLSRVFSNTTVQKQQFFGAHHARPQTNPYEFEKPENIESFFLLSQQYETKSKLQKEKERDYRREMIRNLKSQFRKSTTQIAVTEEEKRGKGRNYEQSNIIFPN